MSTLATPNYGFEKRQRELAKKRKKEDKLRAKADRKVDHPEGEDESMPDEANSAAPDSGERGPSGAG